MALNKKKRRRCISLGTCCEFRSRTQRPVHDPPALRGPVSVGPHSIPLSRSGMFFFPNGNGVKVHLNRIFVEMDIKVPVKSELK